MDVKPWEPVELQFADPETGWYGDIWGWEIEGCWDEMKIDSIYDWSAQDLEARVTLANGQRIIVRALSDKRKAARAAMKEAVS